MHLRLDVQYHWFNEGYHNFDGFLSGLKNAKRKKIKQERRRIKEQGIEFAVLQGNELTNDQWADVHRCYSDTFDRKSGYATFSLDFFLEIASTMGEQIIIVLAMQDGTNVAAAINYRSNDVLYGRHWGSVVDIPGLHFETCYYQGIDYAIAQGINRFEPGAQGEYKMSRGFIPVLTRSAHWIANNKFHTAIYDFIDHEARAIQDYYLTLMENIPYKSGHPAHSRISRFQGQESV